MAKRRINAAMILAAGEDSHCKTNVEYTLFDVVFPRF